MHLTHCQVVLIDEFVNLFCLWLSLQDWKRALSSHMVLSHSLSCLHQTTASKKALKQLKHQLGAFHPDSARAAAVEQQEAAAAADASLVPKRKRTSRTQLQKSGSADIMSSSSASSSSSADPVSLNHYGTPSSTDNASNDPMAALGAIVKRQADLGKLAHSDWPSESGWRAKVIIGGGGTSKPSVLFWCTARICSE